MLPVVSMWLLLSQVAADAGPDANPTEASTDAGVSQPQGTEEPFAPDDGPAAAKPVPLSCPLPTTVDPLHDIVVRCVGSSPSDIATVVFHYRAYRDNTTLSFAHLALRRSPGGWLATVPAHAVVGKAMEYYVEIFVPNVTKPLTIGTPTVPMVLAIADAGAAVPRTAAVRPAQRYERPDPCDSASPDPALCFRERGHLGLFLAGGRGEGDFGYGFGLRAGGRIASFVELGLVAAALLDGNIIRAIPLLAQVNAVGRTSETGPLMDVYAGVQAGLLRRRLKTERNGMVGINGFAFGAQVGTAVHFWPDVSLRLELSWLHGNEASKSVGNGYSYAQYEWSSCDVFLLQTAVCLSF
jgi:hypothetical protein